MPYYPTQEDINVLSFNEKTWYVKIILLNNKFQRVHEMKYEFISGSLSTNVDSDIRNTFSMTLGVINKSVGIEEDKMLWINRFVKVQIGMSVPYWGGEIKWYDKGIFVMTDYNYNVQASTLTINCSDLVCILNGDVGGSLEGLETIIYPAEAKDIREAIIETLTGLSPFQKYYVANMPKPIPYDLEFGATDTVWTILTKLRDLYPGYEMFFDTDGTFICRQVATVVEDPVVLTNNVLEKLYISETDNGVLKDIRNVSKVWGKCLDTDYFTDNCTYNADTNIYSAHFTGIALNTDDNSLPTSTKFAVKIPAVNAADGARIAIYNKPADSETESLVGTFAITNSNEEAIKKDFFLENTSFVFRYRRKSMYVLGQYQIFAVNKLRNTAPSEQEKQDDIDKHGTTDIDYYIIPDSPFAIERIGERMKAFQGGEYDDIEAIDDCITRARYETWLAAKVVYTVTLEMVFIPWLQGNEKIQFRLAATEEIKDWIVQSISSEHPSGVMTLTLVEFSPLFNFEVTE